MIELPHVNKRSQTGIVLVSSLLLLLVGHHHGAQHFPQFRHSERIAGNTRDKQRALQVAGGASNNMRNRGDCQFERRACGGGDGNREFRQTTCAPPPPAPCGHLHAHGAPQICVNTLASLGARVTRMHPG